jgi:uncharacterized membrane protein
MNSAPTLSNKIKLQLLTAGVQSPKQKAKPEAVSKQVNQPLPLEREIIETEAETEDLTLGQRVADAMANKVGSWGFLIGQTIVLTGWIGANLMPGIPHWDQSPFILLNLVFSFASAYTAPVVLMSQNRQSDQERKKAEYDRLVNLQASQNIELLHQKLDTLHKRQLQEMTQIIKMQQQQIEQIKTDYYSRCSKFEP